MDKIAELKKFTTKSGVYNLDLYRTEYADDSGQIALVALVAETHETFSNFTINLADLGLYPTDENNVFIKDYAEGEGVVLELVRHGIIAEPINTHVINQFGSKVYEAKLLK